MEITLAPVFMLNANFIVVQMNFMCQWISPLHYNELKMSTCGWTDQQSLAFELQI